MLVAGAAMVASANASPDDLVSACKSGDLVKVKSLVGSGERVTAPGSDGVLPLMAACLNGHVPVARYLVEAGADVKTPDDYGWTPLAGAARGGNMELVTLLVEQGADPTGKGVWPTPIECAVQGGNKDVVAFLLDKGAPANVVSRSGVSLLMDACGRGDVALAGLLVKHGADVNFKSPVGRNCMTSACFGGHLDMVKLLHGKGLPLCSVDSNGGSCLLFAAMSGNGELVKYILDHGKDEKGESIYVDTLDKDENTPLLVLVSRVPSKGVVDTKMMELLLERGADPSRANAKGLTAIGLLKEFSGKLSEALEKGAVNPGLKSLLGEMKEMEAKMEKKVRK
ncbi:ankyrin repeats (3 copies) [Akkermansia glycaniphila]|uniref:Ankyrin repeats (3 copies) n=2 Tax=Akkermansia glycaniphila TaxID=1679444 RepID=A0A1H6KYM6_9BACT|nr:ankyrin repeats (3 copies) [Akkermansia glycaniphila]